MRIAALIAVFVPAIAQARPVDPRDGGFELGAAGFVVRETRDDNTTGIDLGPLLHLGVHGPLSPSLQLGLTGRIGLGGGGGLSVGATASFAMETRYVFGSLDTMPFLLAGFGVTFSSVRGESGERVSEIRPALPIGVGIESRLTDTLMLGFALRYTFQLSALPDTVGPADVTVCLVFL